MATFFYFVVLPDLLTGLKVFSVRPFLGDVRCIFASLSLLFSSVFCSSCFSCAFPLSLFQCHPPSWLHPRSFHPTIYVQFAHLVACFSILSKFHAPFNHIYQCTYSHRLWRSSTKSLGGQPCYAVTTNARWRCPLTTRAASDQVQNAPTYAADSRRSNRYSVARFAMFTSMDIWTMCSSGSNSRNSIVYATHWRNAQSPQQ